MDIEHKRRYLKYKKKYLELKQSGGNPNLEQFLNQYGIDRDEQDGGSGNLIGGYTTRVEKKKYKFTTNSWYY